MGSACFSSEGRLLIEGHSFSTLLTFLISRYGINTEQGERLTVEITDVRENVAFAEVVERVSYYE